jgi:hypothetical protein
MHYLDLFRKIKNGFESLLHRFFTFMYPFVRVCIYIILWFMLRHGWYFELYNRTRMVGRLTNSEFESIWKKDFFSVIYLTTLSVFYDTQYIISLCFKK